MLLLLQQKGSRLLSPHRTAKRRRKTLRDFLSIPSISAQQIFLVPSAAAASTDACWGGSRDLLACLRWTMAPLFFFFFFFFFSLLSFWDCRFTRGYKSHHHPPNLMPLRRSEDEAIYSIMQQQWMIAISNGCASSIDHRIYCLLNSLFVRGSTQLQPARRAGVMRCCLFIWIGWAAAAVIVSSIFLFFKEKLIRIDAYYTTWCQNIIIISCFFLALRRWCSSRVIPLLLIDSPVTKFRRYASASLHTNTRSNFWCWLPINKTLAARRSSLAESPLVYGWIMITPSSSYRVCLELRFSSSVIIL